MKKIYFKPFVLSALLCIGGLTSCEGYLDTLPSDSLTSDQAITNIQDVQTALNGVYYDLKNAGYYGCDYISRGEVGGEDVQTSSNGVRTEYFYRYTYRQNNAPVGLWAYPYIIINRANVLLEAIEKSKLSGEEVDIAKGEALAVRALCHFDLVLTYGKPYWTDKGASLGVPVVKTVLNADDLPARETVAKVYEEIIIDLNNAKELLKEDISNGHFNKWAVKALLSRVYLHMRNYEESFAYASDVIENSPYTLLKTEEYVAAWSQRYNSESILDIEISELEKGNRELFGYVVDSKGYAAITNTKEFEDLMKEYSNDIRLGLFKNASIEGRTYTNKYPGINGNTAVNNIRVIRLSDIYLIAAESALKKSPIDQASADKYFNAIKKRAIPTASGTETATIDLVLKERRKELVMEGHRLNDIMRLGIKVSRKGGYHFLGNTDLIEPSYEDYRTVMPIPQAEIDVNENIKQNEGYY